MYKKLGYDCRLFCVKLPGRCLEKLNVKTADIHIQVFGTLKLSFHFLEKKTGLKTLISNDLTLIFYNSGDSLK